MGSLTTATASAFLAVLSLPLATAVAQESATESVDSGLNDPEFRRIVETGPGNSEELELAVTTYAANDMPERVVDVFVHYLDESGGSSDAYCRFCMSLLPQSHGYAESELAGRFFEATDRIVDRAIDDGSSDALIRLAVISASSNVREHRDRALYFLTAAAQIGIEDADRLVVVQTLANLGLTAHALAIAESIHADPGSTYYESQTVKQWITYLEFELNKTDTVGGLIAAAATVR